MKVEKSDVLAFTISDVERLDPVRVVIENYEPGKGRITVTCFGKAWTGAWFAMGEDNAQEFIKRVSNDYLIGYFDPQLQSTVDDDNDANLEFVKGEIIKLRRQQEIDAEEARDMWVEAENAEDVKESCCDCRIGNKLPGLLGDDPWYAKWPAVPNHNYQYLERIIDAVRGGLAELERAA
ncbi:TPA: hypothetical protein ACTLRO_000109 [Klebsiella pneumoniae]|uniref:hypothetical protein n=1 Tax=Klebsiella pneumoniae TaxID=573 RepID=UPI0009B9F54F|nr:hypothetical protein [Klebsiella pneumoniae]EKJ7349181.1 hypothetical protein [Klebsiella pneumoniae]EKJ7749228.1 hypothetical protein [Klebsiella pneumoniae]EKV4519024.1 hypothetical protein [Klebsiella pneumoniae]EKW0310484.1 hypothetical protein [Klebsiella pneumoniae]EKW6109197.1 hypothetical protein [Klebsiella pneumoniae]